MFENLIESKQKGTRTVGQTVLSVARPRRPHLRGRQGDPGCGRDDQEPSGRHHDGVPQAAPAAAAAARPAAARVDRRRESAAEGVPDGGGADGHPEGHSADRPEREALRSEGLHRQGRRGRHRDGRRGRHRSGDAARCSWRRSWTIRSSRSPSRRRAIRPCCRAPGSPGAVDLQYVVDTTGHAEPDSLQGAQDDAPGVRRAGQGSDREGRVQAGQVQGPGRFASWSSSAFRSRSASKTFSLPRRHGNMSLDLLHLWAQMGVFAKGIVVVMAIMSIYSLTIVVHQADPAQAQRVRDPEVRAPVLPRHPGGEPRPGHRAGREEQEEPRLPRAGRGAGRSEAAAA